MSCSLTEYPCLYFYDDLNVLELCTQTSGDRIRENGHQVPETVNIPSAIPLSVYINLCNLGGPAEVQHTARTLAGRVQQ